MLYRSVIARRLGCMLCFLAALPVARAAADLRDSVVKIYTTQRRPNFARPWTKATPREISGTGAIIEGKRIITNAHVVLHATRVMVQANQSSRRVRAKVVAIAPEIDLALLEVGSDSFFEGRPALPFAQGLPELKQTVNVYGFPIGGEQMSVTEGIVSRVEYASYRYGTRGLRIQVDAALNPGNSGGPAVIDGHIVGVVFSRISGADNIGYLIPVEEVDMFRKDVADGKYDGKPRMLDQMQTVENEALRDFLKLPADAGGMMITKPFDKSDSYPLKPNDVILKVGPHDVDRQGRVEVRPGLRLSFQYMIPKLSKNGGVPLTVWRDGKSIEVKGITKLAYPRLVPYLKNSYPSYFILGPMVFTVGTQDLVAAIGAKAPMIFAARGNPLILRQFDRPKKEGEQLVVMGIQMFSHPIREGYDHQTLGVIATVNDTKIENLGHLVKTIREAQGEYITFNIAGAYERLVFRREELLETTSEILDDEGIRRQYSEDLAPFWEKK